MSALSRRELLALLMTIPAAASAFANEAAEDCIPLFNGKTLNGWKVAGQTGAFKVADGAVIARGGPATLIYVGSGREADFRNFELSAEVMLRPGAKSAICFHTAPESSGALRPGFQVLLADSEPLPSRYVERRKTGSLLGLRNVYKELVGVNEWFTLNIRCAPEAGADPAQSHARGGLHRARGSLFGKCRLRMPHRARHDSRYRHSTREAPRVFRNLHVRPLPDAIPQLSNERPAVDDVYREIIRLGAENFPVVDYHAHLKGGLTLEQALANSRRVGIGYGIAINCGLSFPVHDDASVRDYLESMKGQPCYVALQGEGREWPGLVSPESIARFDYTFTDAMTFTDDTGKRMSIWIPEEIGIVGNEQAFMEMYLKRIEGVMREPIDIYANATYLPDQIAADYDALWTPERMQRVIDAALKYDVAIEINNRRRIPSAAFIKRAKAAGCKFSFGTNNAEAELGRLEYPIRMVRECGLACQDIFVPRPDGSKPIQLK